MRQTFVPAPTALAWFAALVCLAAGSVLAAKPGKADATNSPVWPAPPDAARIAFERTLTCPADLGIKRPALGRFVSWLTGEGRGRDAFVKPFGLAVDAAGNLCLTDTATRSVGCFEPASRRWRQWSEVGPVKFRSPVGVARHGDTLFVVDSELGELIAFTTDGKLQFRVGQPLVRPTGIAVTKERIWVADAGTHQLHAFDLAGRALTTLGKRGTAPGEFNYPTHVAVDDAGRIYVTDAMNCRVQLLDAEGRSLRQIGRAGTSAGQFSRPKGIAVSRAGHLYVADALFDNVQIFDGEGRLLLAVGQAGKGPGEFGLPAGIAIAPDGRIMIADCFNGRIQVLRPIGSE